VDLHTRVAAAAGEHLTDPRRRQRPAVTCDEIAPTFDVLRVTPNVLFPPDQSYVDVSAVVEVSDDFDDSSAVRLVQVRSNEPDNGEEDGNTVNDRRT